MAFNKLDLPTPLWPENTEARPNSNSRSRSMPKPFCALVSNVGMPSWL